MGCAATWLLTQAAEKGFAWQERKHNPNVNTASDQRSGASVCAADPAGRRRAAHRVDRAGEAQALGARLRRPGRPRAALLGPPARQRGGVLAGKARSFLTVQWCQGATLLPAPSRRHGKPRLQAASGLSWLHRVCQ